MHPVITEPMFYVFAVPAVILLGLSKGGFAGLGTATTPMLALYMPPLEAAALILPVLMTQDAIAVWWYRHDWDGWNLKVMLPGGLIGMAVAWLLAAYITEAHVRLIIGIIGVVFCIHAFARRSIVEPKKPNAASGVFWGAVSGFTSFMSQAGGPPFQVHILPQRMPKLILVGTTTLFFAVINAMKIVPYFALGQFSAKNFATSLMLLPVAVAANFAGIWLVQKTPTGLFYKIAYTLVFIISLALLWRALREML
ncbi:MAG TPA: sulfite exporter TauE/SafE family protein [Pseudorhodoplanes sp.]|jgi:uncharacterized membrane protein YfcA|nr:sulfite exporter TauE/SafE family protein [Pseudorhodoplanes sp.]